MAKVELLRPIRGKAKGEVIEVSDKTAKLLKAVGRAKDYVEAVMEPQQKQQTPPEPPEAETETTESRTGFRRRYSRRDMTPEEE